MQANAELTRSQRRTLDGLVGSADRVSFPADVVPRLRDRIEEAARAFELAEPLWLGKPNYCMDTPGWGMRSDADSNTCSNSCYALASMAKRRIHVTAIHNRTRPRAEVHYPKDDDTMLVVPPDQTITGSWFIVYEPFEHPELDGVSVETELWFVNSPTEFRWGSHTFADGPMHLNAFLRLYDELV